MRVINKHITVTMPLDIAENKDLMAAISYGFNSRSEFYYEATIALAALIDQKGLEKGIAEMKKRLEVK